MPEKRRLCARIAAAPVLAEAGKSSRGGDEAGSGAVAGLRAMALDVEQLKLRVEWLENAAQRDALDVWLAEDAPHPRTTDQGSGTLSGPRA